MNELELEFGIGCDLLKIADALTEGVEDYEVDGETGETEEFWDWVSERGEAIV